MFKYLKQRNNKKQQQQQQQQQQKNNTIQYNTKNKTKKNAIASLTMITITTA